MRAVIAWLLLYAWSWLCAASPIPVTVALPGPGNLPYLPVELMSRIGADREEGVEVNLRFFTGGPLALKDMLAGNSDFASLGFTALTQIEGVPGKAYAVASMTQVPAFSLMVSSALKGRVRSVADLRGRSIGVPTGGKAGKSVGRQLAEFLLKRAGVPLEEVNFVSSGMDHQHHAAILRSGVVDALFTNEPSATALEAHGIAFRLADLHDPGATRRHFGSLYLYTHLAARADLMRQRPDLVRRMVAALRRTLGWMERHTGQEIAAQMGIADPEARSHLARVIERHKGMFIGDGCFSAEAVRGSAALIQSLSPDGGTPPDLEPFIDVRWVGRRP